MVLASLYSCVSFVQHWSSATLGSNFKRLMAITSVSQFLSGTSAAGPIAIPENHSAYVYTTSYASYSFFSNHRTNKIIGASQCDPWLTLITHWGKPKWGPWCSYHSYEKSLYLWFVAIMSSMCSSHSTVWVCTYFKSEKIISVYHICMLTRNVAHYTRQY